MKAVLQILQGEQHQRKIIDLCDENAAVKELVVGIISGKSEGKPVNLIAILRRFSEDETPLHERSDTFKNYIATLMNFCPFTDKFGDLLPGTVCSSSEEEKTPDQPLQDAETTRC